MEVYMEILILRIFIIEEQKNLHFSQEFVSKIEFLRLFRKGFRKFNRHF